jgi:hypothetical protein
MPNKWGMEMKGVVASAAEKGYAVGGAHAMFEDLRTEQQKLYDQGKFSPLDSRNLCTRGK